MAEMTGIRLEETAVVSSGIQAHSVRVGGDEALRLLGTPARP